MNETIELKTGDRVRLNGGRDMAAWDGLTATIVNPPTGGFAPTVQLDDGLVRPDGFGNLTPFAWRDLTRLDETETPDETEPATDVDPDALRDELARVSEELESVRADLDAARTRAQNARFNHERDIAAIGDRLMEEAETRNWCSEYDGIVDSLNGELIVELPNRSREYSVRVEVTYLFTVEARDEEDAREQADDMEPSDMDPYPNTEIYVEEN